MRKAEQQGVLPAREPPWLQFLTESEGAEYEAARPDAMKFEKRRLAYPQYCPEYQAVPDPTGARAKPLERLQTARRA
jgi:hypothetical protein